MELQAIRPMFDEYLKKIRLYNQSVKDDTLSYHSYLSFLKAKMEYQKDLFKGEHTIIIPPPSADEYFATVKKQLRATLIERKGPLLRQLTRYDSYKIFDDILKSFMANEKMRLQKQIDALAVDFDSISIEELKNNSLLETRSVEGRRYDKGMRVSKFLSKIGFEDRDYASIQFDYDNVKQSLSLSLEPGQILYGGVIGESCYSPSGSNNHATIETFRYAQGMIAYSNDPDRKWRAWVYVQPDNKTVYIAASHPYEDQIKQQALYNYFISMGYKIADDLETTASVYLDSGRSKVREAFTEHVIDYTIHLKDLGITSIFSGYGDTCDTCGEYVVKDARGNTVNHECEGSDEEEQEDEE